VASAINALFASERTNDLPSANFDSSAGNYNQKHTNERSQIRNSAAVDAVVCCIHRFECVDRSVY
jgi:hypothetical protein